MLSALNALGNILSKVVAITFVFLHRAEDGLVSTFRASLRFACINKGRFINTEGRETR
jgi:hypothetical protein